MAAATELDPAIEATLYDYIGNDYTNALFPDEASWVHYTYFLFSAIRDVLRG